MTDVFISYSRKDKEFVQVLHQALTESKYEAWVDWEDIPLTADWWEEIKAGIEAADTFIFVISPDSISSKVCGQEIDHAVSNNKRLVPIVRRDGFDGALAHPSLKKPNWLYFRAEDDFEETFQALVKAINIDLAHVKAHTQLLVDAIRWDRKERDVSLLLSGKLLEEANEWLIQASMGRNPEPTVLQTEYVTSSRQAEAAQRDAEIERQRAEIDRQKRARKTILFALIVASVGFIVSTALGIVTFKQGQVAKKREINAEIVAQSLRVEKLFSTGQEIEALIQGLKTWQQVEKSAQLVETGTRMQALDAINQVVYSIKERNHFSGHEMGVYGVSFSPDGQTIASASEDGTIKLWTLEGEEFKTLLGHSGPVNDVSFSPNGQIIASADRYGAVKLWDFSGQEIQTLKGHQLSVRSVSFSPNGQTIASASLDNTVKLWDINGRELKTLDGHRNAVWSVSFSPDGQTIASGSYDKTVKLWDLDGKELQTLQGHSNHVWSVSFSPDGQMIASGSRDKTVKLWDLDGKELQTLQGHSGTVRKVSFSPDGQMIASADEDGIVKLWDLEGRELQTIQVHSHWINSVSFSPDSQMLTSASSDGTIKLWELGGKNLQILQGHSNEVNSVSFSPDGQMLTSASRDGTVKLWDLSGQELQTLQSHSGTVSSVSFSPDGP